MSDADAIDLLDSRRFDIPAKTLCARYLEENIDSRWGIEVYARHLEVWNGLRELSPVKKGLDEYLASFREILALVGEDKFDFDQWPVSLDPEGAVVNGGHRLAAAIYHGKRVRTRAVEAGQGQICPWPYLRDRRKHVPAGLEPPFADAMALEYMRLKRDRTGLFVVMVFPAARGHEEAIRGILGGFGQMVYDKQIHFTANGAINLIRQVYFDEPWLGRIEEAFPGAVSKAAPCFSRKGPMRVYLVDSPGRSDIVELKGRIRDIFGIQNHSVHINDTNDQAFHLANMLFSRTTLHFLNNAMLQPGFEVFNRQFADFRKWLLAEGVDTEGICVDASSTLSAYGLRQGRDIDFLHAGEVDISGTPPDINSHNDWAQHYDESIHDILYNPTRHFYYDGIKFTTPAVVHAMKRKRGEKKDIRDCALLETLPPVDVMPEPGVVTRIRRRPGVRQFLRSLRSRLRPGRQA